MAHDNSYTGQKFEVVGNRFKRPDGAGPRFAHDYLEAGHSAAQAVANGTLALSFNAARIDGVHTLFSKDGRGYDEGGQLVGVAIPGAGMGYQDTISVLFGCATISCR